MFDVFSYFETFYIMLKYQRDITYSLYMGSSNLHKWFLQNILAQLNIITESNPAAKNIFLFRKYFWMLVSGVHFARRDPHLKVLYILFLFSSYIFMITFRRKEKEEKKRNNKLSNNMNVFTNFANLSQITVMWVSIKK